MAFSEVSICNMALARLGQSVRIAALSEPTPAAKACNLFYATLRDTVLEDACWPFANKIAALGLIEEDPNDDWGYSYAYPTDCLAARHLVTGTRIPPWPRYEIGQAGAARVIWTDEANAVLKYTARITDPARFSPSFGDALAWRLATDLAMPLACKPGIMQAMSRQYDAAVRKAEAYALNEQDVDGEQPDASMITARS